MANSSSQSLKKMDSLFARHGQAFFSSLGRLWRQPLANLMTIAVIGIALALPATLYILLQNVQSLSHGWTDNAQITLFLKQDVTPSQVQVLQQQLNLQNDISKVTYISPEQGLKQFEHESGFGHVLQQLHTNPLPEVLIVQPGGALTTPLAIHELVNRLQSLPQVGVAQLDMGWIKRLFGIIDLAEHGVWALGALLAVAVILIVGNTIRLSIQNRRDEIEVTKLVGATNAFVRRPFLYTGILYGFFGALIAYILVSLLLTWLSAPVAKLAGLYESSFALSGFNLLSSEVLFIIGMGLGLLGAWIAVTRQLRQIEPS